MPTRLHVSIPNQYLLDSLRKTKGGGHGIGAHRGDLANAAVLTVGADSKVHQQGSQLTYNCNTTFIDRSKTKI